MHRPCYLAATLIVLAGSAFAGAATPPSDSPAIPTLVGRTAMVALPEPLRAYFTQNDAALCTHALAAFGGAPRSGGLRLMLDVQARGKSAPAASAAARSFPRDRVGARRLFEKHGISDGGTLPWVLDGRVTALTAAFRSLDEEGMLREAGAVVGLSAAAALPFNATIHRDGGGYGNLSWAPGLHATPRIRYQTTLIERLRERLAYEMRVHPDRLVAVTDPVAVAFDTLLAAHRQVRPLLDVDRALTSELALRDAETFLAAADEYYERLAVRTAATMESQLESGALLAASLIMTAWQQAGRPALPMDGAGLQSAPVHPGGFVASRQSNKFHAADCRHAGRIKPANVVRFKTAAEAVAAGRTPCGTCRPAP